MQPSIADIRARVDWRALKITAEVARTRSIKRAAINTNLTEGTVSRYISALEQQLGVCLFERSSRGMSLTDPGQLLVDRLYDAEAQLEAGLESAIARQNKPVGNVRLTAVPSISNRVLAQRAPDLLEKYPELELEIIGIPTDLSLMRREVDIAIRLALPSTEMDVLTRKIGVLRYGVYMLRDKSGGGPFTNPANLPWLTYGRLMSGLPHAKWIQDYVTMSGEKTSKLKFYDAEGLICAALMGAGKILLPRIVAKETPDLVEIDGYNALPRREIWSLVHPNIATTERICVVLSWIETIFSQGSSWEATW